MSSTGPSPLFVPLNPSPRLVAQMTGLSLRQSELEVSQQRNLKRMLRRIRASRHHHAARHHHRKQGMSLLTLPAAATLSSPADNEGGEWSDDTAADDDALALLRRNDLHMDISDNPAHDELARRVAELFNSVFEPLPPIDPAHVEVRRLSGAMTNCVFMVSVVPPPPALRHLNKPDLPSKYLLRVYGTGVDEFLSREKELYWLSQLTSLGFGPRLYGIFANGRLEEFLESTTLTKDDIRNQSTSKHIARRMCELHSLVSYYRPFDLKHRGGLSAAGGVPELWSNVDSWLRLVAKKWPRIRHACRANPTCEAILNDWSSLEHAVAKLRRVILAANPPVVFAHDDLQYGNILRLEATGELVVVDFEYAGYNYRAFDIANHFCEWMADYHHPEHPHRLLEDRYPTAAQRCHFLRTYVKASAFLNANMRAHKDVVESDHDAHLELRAIRLDDDRIRDEIAALDNEIVPFVPASHLHWGIWGLLQACSSEIDFDYVAYAAQRLSIFLRMVDQL